MPRTLPRSLFIASLTLIVLSVALAVRSPEKSEPAAQEQLVPAAPAHAPLVPRYWKGNLHTHSLWSDGDDYPEMIADWYAKNGYHFLTLSEHNIIADGDRWIDGAANATRIKATEKYLKRFGNAWVEQQEKEGKKLVRLKPLREFRSLLETPGQFLLIPGEEVTGSFQKRPLHMNAVNLKDPLKPIEGQDMPESIRVNLKAIAEAQKKAGWPGLTFVNHPNFGWAITAEDMVGVPELQFFEVFNGHSGVRNYGDATHASLERVWDILLAMRLGKLQLPIVYGLGTDDAHGYHEFGLGKVNPGRGWIQVRAVHLTAENIIRSMVAGDFYSSSGVVLDDVRVKDGTLHVKIRAEKGVTYKTEFIATQSNANLDSKPTLDKDGKVLAVTRQYSEDIGKVVAQSMESEASYKFTGMELYVRARITSNKPHPNPYAKGDLEMAWTQPVRP